MKIRLLALFLISISIYTKAQVNFEPAYIINNEGIRTACLIKNYNWKNNPSEFEYCLTATGDIRKGDISTIKEFGIIGFSRFVKSEIRMDTSLMETSVLSDVREPLWVTKILFLEVLVEGKATLYYFSGNSLQRFFYSVSDSPVQQLVYKKYFINSDQVTTNSDFRKQLYRDVRCRNTAQSTPERMNFGKPELIRYFKAYNDSCGNSSVLYGYKDKQHLFHLRLTPGLNYSSLSVTSIGNKAFNTEFTNQSSFRLGVEAEYVFPFNKNKWSSFIEPGFQQFNATGHNKYHSPQIRYKAIEFPAGFRHYFFLNQNMKLFFNAMIVPGLELGFNSEIAMDNSTSFDISTRISYAFGGGLSYKRFSAEIRYYTNRDLLNGYIYWYNDYSRLAFIVGFRIL